ncbi:MAG: sulfotransferase [Actinomycetota bacterium]
MIQPHSPRSDALDRLAQLPIRPSPCFALGMGRSGTHFLAALLATHPRVASFHLDHSFDPVADAFDCWAAWHHLPVDHGLLAEARAERIYGAASQGRVYFEANPLLTPLTTVLSHCFDARFVLVYRDPAAVVRSHQAKGWYSERHVRLDTRLAPGFQAPYRRTSHVFSRLTPSGDEEYRRWATLTIVGRLAWLWAAYYRRALADMRQSPGESMVLDIASVDQDGQERLCTFLSVAPVVKPHDLQALRRRPPGRSRRSTMAPEWNSREQREFESETEHTRATLEALRWKGVHG